MQLSDSLFTNPSARHPTDAPQSHRERECILSANENDYNDKVPDTRYEQGVDVEVIALGKVSRQLKRWTVTSNGQTRRCSDGVIELSVTYRNKECGWVPAEQIVGKASNSLSPLQHAVAQLDHSQEAHNDGLSASSGTSSIFLAGEDDLEWPSFQDRPSFTNRGTQLEIAVQGESEELKIIPGTSSGMTRYGEDGGDELLVHCDKDVSVWVKYDCIIPTFDYFHPADDDDGSTHSGK